MISLGNFEIFMPWVSVLLVAEMLIDLTCLLACIRWWIANDASKDSLPLRLGAAAAILHALRVMVFVLGRTGPWINFDVRPEHQALHDTRWTWGEVYFAATMSVLGVVGVLVIWWLRQRRRK